VQSFNWPAILTTARVVFRQPSLALPHLKVRDIRDIDFQRLRRAGCAGVVFDKDNTLTAPYADCIDPRLASAVQECCDAFGPERVVVMSNSAGTADDPGHRDADRLQRSMGLTFLRRAEKKPRGIESVREHFRGCDPSSLCMIGDRYLTDVVFGNLHGMLCVHTDQLTSRGDNPMAKLMHRLERCLVAIWLRLGYVPPAHPLRSQLKRSAWGHTL